MRPWTLDDVPAIAAMCDETEIARWIHQIPSPYTERDAREYVLAAQAAWRDRTGAFFAVVERETGELAGSISIHVIDPEAANVDLVEARAARRQQRGELAHVDAVGASGRIRQSRVCEEPLDSLVHGARFALAGSKPLGQLTGEHREDAVVDPAVLALVETGLPKRALAREPRFLGDT